MVLVSQSAKLQTHEGVPTNGEILEHPKTVAFDAKALIMTHYEGKEKTLS